MTATSPAVSVVLPFRNAADTLAPAIDSLQRQTFSPFECLLIDNQSSDGSRAIARRACQADRRFRVIAQTGNLVDALNAGCAAAQGAFIARMDADDLATPHRLAAQHAMLVADPSLAVAKPLWAMMLRWTSDVPDAIVSARANSQWYCHWPSSIHSDLRTLRNHLEFNQLID